MWQDKQSPPLLHLAPGAFVFRGLNVVNNSASQQFGVSYHLIFEGEHFRSLVCICPQLPKTRKELSLITGPLSMFVVKSNPVFRINAHFLLIVNGIWHLLLNMVYSYVKLIFLLMYLAWLLLRCIKFVFLQEHVSEISPVGTHQLSSIFSRVWRVILFPINGSKNQKVSYTWEFFCFYLSLSWTIVLTLQKLWYIEEISSLFGESR
jgi:hypothetical protein